MKNSRILVQKGVVWLAWFICLLAITNVSLAQTALNQPDPVANKVVFTGVVSQDRLNNVYLTDQQNNLHKYDASGKLITTFSPPLTGRIAMLEAWNPAKILLFYDDQQKIIFLDRFLTPISTVNVRDYADGLVKAATFSSDNKIWAFNESSFSLHKIDLQYPEASRTMPLDLLLPRQTYDIRFMREYQNNLYVVDKLSGVYVFDNLGNYQKRLPFTGLSFIGFRGDELYYLQNGKIHLFHLYSLQDKTLDLPVDVDAANLKQIVMDEEQLFLIAASGIKVIPLK
ncbi:hypothetical protein HUW51_05975 [Adhaeribacter swui]|uniref:6-bladed beta-propeller n=1 Tax=Adhaeribacter swui TaxID=2086471 RepID=A0A7G7G563_9BACT|nr:hypothetical protein [Adhaeribacter swui]QNF32297.1 hypothetical protein HUW51_05975 [Adhaeribacter swui]